MQLKTSSDRATFESVFLFSCPPFINPTTPDFDSALKDTKHIPDTIQVHLIFFLKNKTKINQFFLIKKGIYKYSNETFLE